MEYLQGLNPNQSKAVQHTKGPLMIIAGAGSGKTKVLTTRIAHLLKTHKVDAFNILALTFTNKAAKEMKERVEHIVGNNEARNLFIGTFHSVFARLLRTDAPLLGYPNNFTIYDSDDAKSLIKTIINEKSLDDKFYKPAAVYSRISSAKNSLVSWADYKKDAHIQQEDFRSGKQLMGEIYEAYAKRCFKNGAMDFDDLLVNMYRILTELPEQLYKYQHKFKYVMIDEYQDTNVVQYQIVKMLAAVHENICIVGDDAQSIYSFRGATIQNILQFEKDYDDVTVIKLEQNYRSTQCILKAANNVIAQNSMQIQKNLWTQNDTGDKIKIAKTISDNDEGKFVADAIHEQRLRNHYANKDFAILYRTNAQSRSFEESLRRLNIPYKIYGGISFYQRKEIKDYIAYLRVVNNAQDEEAIKRIINYPARGIGKTTLDKLGIYALENDKPYWEVIQAPTLAGIKGATAENIIAFVQMIKHFRLMLEKSNAYEVAFAIGKNTGLVKELYTDKSVEGLARYENVQALLNSIKEFTETPNEDAVIEDKSLGNYLQQITLLTDSDKETPEDADTVKLMTIHAAKGLEFPCVFVVGVEENLFPGAQSIYEREDLEEERRLFYVAITRAKARLWCTYANMRYRFGQLVSNECSRFIAELPEEFVSHSHTNSSTSNFGGSFQKRNTNTFSTSPRSTSSAQASSAPTKSIVNQVINTKLTPNTSTTYTHEPSQNFTPCQPNEILVGITVEHQKFGYGIVEQLDGAEANKIAHVNFKHGGIKRIMLNYAKLHIVN